jgi:hypothetical protein
MIYPTKEGKQRVQISEMVILIEKQSAQGTLARQTMWMSKQ